MGVVVEIFCAQNRRAPDFGPLLGCSVTSMSDFTTARLPFATAILATFLCSSATGDPVAKATHFVCDVGPVTKHFGRSDWQVLSCGDGRTLLFQSLPGKPGADFSIAIEKDSIERGNESMENRDLDEAAIAELGAMSHEKLLALLHETEAVAPQ